jgi:tetratricopeptide (TPR) repeat protein
LETWKAREDDAAAASKRAHFGEAAQLLEENEKLAETFPPKDARLPRTLFDLAEIYRAEGKYSEALALYERASQIYTSL